MMKPEQAERIALECLAHIVGNEDLCAFFLGSTGANIDDLRSRAGDADFLVSVLAFLTMDDQWVIGFCDNAGYGYETPLQALNALPGGAAFHWT